MFDRNACEESGLVFAADQQRRKAFGKLEVVSRVALLNQFALGLYCH